MYMAGYTDEDAFDADLKARMPLDDLVTRITRPVLMGIGRVRRTVSGAGCAGDLRTHRGAQGDAGAVGMQSVDRASGGGLPSRSSVQEVPVAAQDPPQCGQFPVQHPPLELVVGTDVVQSVRRYNAGAARTSHPA